MSHGPIRKALRQLEQERLVVTFPYRGTEALDVSQEEFAQVLVPLRLILECLAFRHALPKVTEVDFGATPGHRGGVVAYRGRRRCGERAIVFVDRQSGRQGSTTRFDMGARSPVPHRHSVL